MSEKNRNAASENMNTSQTIDRRTYLKLAGMTGSGIGAGIGTGALGTQFTAPARAASVIEDFNYSSSSEMRDHYHFDMGESNASLESVSSTATSDASDSVLEINGGNAKMVAYDDNDGSDLTAYPQVGETITCWIRGANATENMNVIYGAEDGDGRDDHYYVKVDMDKSTMGIGVVDDGNATWLQSAPEDPSFSTNAWYKLEIQWNDTSPNTHDVTLFDQSGNSVASLSYDGSDSADPHHEGRGFGYSAYLSSSDEAAYYDYSKTSDGSDDGSPDLSKWENNVEHSIVEDFELTNVQEDYTFDRGNPEGATLVRDSDYTGSNPLGPTYSGQKALRISDYNVEMTRQPSDGLNNYPSPGTTSSCWVMASGGADRLNLSYGVTDPQNRYFVRVNFEKDRLVLYKYKNNDSTWLDSDSTGSTLSQDKWYWVEINWGSDGTHSVELYDRDDNVLAEATASGDADLESGRGIGFDAYLENVSGSIFFDGFILGEHDPQEAGWGTHHLCDFVSRDENDDDIFYIWDFQYALGHPGMRGPFTTTVDGTEVQYYEYDFPLASSFHTYEMDHQSYTTNPDPSDLTGRTVQSQNTFSLDIQDTNTNGFDYIDVNQSQSKTFYLTPSEHRDWVDNNWGQKASRDEWKEKHIEEEGSDLLWETFFTVAGGVAGFLIGGPVGGAAGTAIGGIPIINELTSDDCGRDETAQDEFHEIVWDYCERTPLTGHIVQLTIKVPANETVEAVVESQVGSDDAYPAVNTGQWRIEITGGQASTSLLSSEPICNR